MDVLGRYSRVWIWVLVGLVNLVHQNPLFSWSLNDEGIALLKFKERVVIDPFGALSTWNENCAETDPCSWFGVECADGNVVSLNMENCCLGGMLAPELGHLVHIKSIRLCNNSFSGGIPEGIEVLKELEMLDLSCNGISGTFPAELVKNVTILLSNNGLCCHRSPEPEVSKMLSDVEKDKSHSADIIKEVPYRGKTEAPSVAEIGVASQHSKTAEDAIGRRGLVDRYPPWNKSPSPSSHANKTAPAHALAPSENHQIQSSKNHLALILPIAIGGFAAVVSVLGLFLWRRNKITTVGPWVTGFSGQLQKALIIGADRSHKELEFSNARTYTCSGEGVPKLKRFELEVACEDFSNVISSSSIGTIYKGTLSNGLEIAVLSFAATSSKVWSSHLETQFRSKVDCLSKVNHKNFVNLLGYCEEEEPFTRMLVFEYAPNGTLFEHLHIKEAEHLDWKMRLRVAMGMVYFFEYMHELTPPVIHGKIHSSSVYLSEDYAAKISDFVFANEEAITGGPLSGPSMSTTLAAATMEDDVYSFGLVLLEMMTGRFLEDWTSDYLTEQMPIREMIDPTLRYFDAQQLERICEVMRSCLHPDPRYRLKMGEVATRLREVTSINPDGAAPKSSPLWWAELEVLSVNGS